MDLGWYKYAGIIAAGIFAGIVNTLAGGGSLLIIPLLTSLFNMSFNIANGTNRIAILLGALTSSGKYKKEKVLDQKQGLLYGIPTILGALAGSILASFFVKNEVMEKIFGGILILMIPLILFKPKLWLESKNMIRNRKYIAINIMVFFLVGVYGGFIQAGVGYFLLISLVLSAGFDLFKANVLKVFLVLLYTPIALVIFYLNDHVDLKIGLILAAGNMIGAYIGAKIAIKKGAGFIRYFLIAALLFFSMNYFGLFDKIMFFKTKAKAGIEMKADEN